jgi:uncharacterized protein (DUF779 family)
MANLGGIPMVGKIEKLDTSGSEIKELVKRLNRLIDILEEQNDIMLYDVGGCCSGCDGTCGEED